MKEYNLILKTLIETVQIVLIVTILMVIIEILSIKFSKFIEKYITKNTTVQYLLSSFAGLLPGCGGSFVVTNLYMANIVTFGALNTTMAATMGDEAFVFLGGVSGSPHGSKVIIVFFVILFLISILTGIITKFIVRKAKIRLCEKCEIKIHDNFDKKFNFKHFIKEHLYGHIIKKHIPKMAVWIFFVILFINVSEKYFSFGEFISRYPVLTLLLAGLVGLIPASGPNLVFINLFLKGQLPFGILLANSIIQEGHGLLPLLGYSVKDVLISKGIRFVIGIGFGLIFLMFNF